MGPSTREQGMTYRVLPNPRPKISDRSTMDFDLKDSGERREFDTGAVRDRRAGKGRFDLLPPHAIHRLAKVYEKGAEKYGDRNWEKGIPEQDLMDSALRHCFMYQQGARDEDHLMQAVFNLMAVVELQETSVVSPEYDLKIRTVNVPGYVH